MKVLNFLEWCKRIKQWHSDNGAQTKIINDALFKVYEADRFYLQPFKPEMITELFEGWFFVTPSYYQSKEFTLSFGEDLEGQPETIYTIFDNNNKLQCLIEIETQTLNDFISNCQRAGISLEWKKEIADKYFGGVK